MGPWHPSENTLFFCTNATRKKNIFSVQMPQAKYFFWTFATWEVGGGVNKVTPSQPERDPIGQTPKEKEACSMAKGKKVAYRAPAAQDCKPPLT